MTTNLRNNMTLSKISLVKVFVFFIRPYTVYTVFFARVIFSSFSICKQFEFAQTQSFKKQSFLTTREGDRNKWGGANISRNAVIIYKNTKELIFFFWNRDIVPLIISKLEALLQNDTQQLQTCIMYLNMTKWLILI